MDPRDRRPRSRSRDRAPPSSAAASRATAPASRPRVDYGAINAQIKSARNAAELRSIGRTHGEGFGGMQHSMIMTACTRFRGDEEATVGVCALAARAYLRHPRGGTGRDARGAAGALYALAKVNAHRVRLPADISSHINVQALNADVGREACHMSRDFNAQEAANSLWAAATLGIRDDAIVGALAAACVAQSRTFIAQDAANSLWAAAAIGMRDESFYR